MVLFLRFHWVCLCAWDTCWSNFLVCGFTTYPHVLYMSSLCASAYVLVIYTLFTQLPIVDVRLYKGGAAGFSLLFLPEVPINSTVSEFVSYMRA